MADKSLFVNKSSSRNPEPKAADTVNHHGKKAYSLSDRQALAQIAVTNCLNGTYYASSSDNLKAIQDAVRKMSNDAEFIAKVALYARDKGHMKDMPAYILAELYKFDKDLFKKMFPKIITNGKMLRNIFMFARSGQITGKPINVSAGTWRRAIQSWFDSRSEEQILRAYVGSDPSLKDILKKARPKPNTPQKDGLFAWITGKSIEGKEIPKCLADYLLFKEGKTESIPNVDFRMLTSITSSDQVWKNIVENAGWMATRMNLNTYARHNVFKSQKHVDIVKNRLSNAEEIAKSKNFPFEIYKTWKATLSNNEIPSSIKNALCDAMEISIENVPELPGKGYVFVDSSGSMSSNVTGGQSQSNEGRITCNEAAALIASALLRKNHDTTVLSFDTGLHSTYLNPRDTVSTNISKLARGGGGTDTTLPLKYLIQENLKADWIVYVSDYETWAGGGYYGTSTGMSKLWHDYKKKNPNCKLVCIDLTPNTTSQVEARKDSLNVGGFSDSVFDVVAKFIESNGQENYWSNYIDAISLD